MRAEQLLELYRRAFVHIQLQAVVDPQRVFELAETMAALSEGWHLEDGQQRCQDYLESYLRRYPDGGDDLREALGR